MAFMPYIFATAAPAVGSIPAEFNVSPTGANSQVGDSAEYVTELLLSFAKCSDVIN